MELPRFAGHLPEGKFLDWAFSETVGKLRGERAPSAAVVQELWELLDDTAAAHVTLRTEDPGLLSWIAARATGREAVRQALLENPATTMGTVEEVLRESRPGERAHRTLAKSRSQRDLGHLLARGLINADHPREAVSWLGAHGALAGGAALTEAFEVTDEHHWALLAVEVLRTEPTAATFDPSQLLEKMRELPRPTVSETMWRALGGHLAARGTADARTDALDHAHPALRAELVNLEAVTLVDALHGATPEEQSALVRRISTRRRLGIDDTRAISTVELTAAEWHDLSFEPAAASWAITDGPDVLAAGAGWQTENDALLVRLLRRRPEAHVFARHHLRRLAKIWPRLSQRTKQQISTTFDLPTLRLASTGPIREWLITNGSADLLRALQDGFNKTEVKKLVERAERTLDPEIAWVAAWTAERPRDRVRMVEIGLRHAEAARRIGEWVRTASPTEIGRIWHLAEEPMREPLSKALVSLLRSSEETGWIEKVLPELVTDWQNAPVALQEHAALWLTQNADDPGTWPALWSLYHGWNGTLEDLLRAARHL
jgi:hypothetical protein